MTDNVLIFSIGLVGYDELFNSCISTQRSYSRRCGYEYVLVDRAPRSLSPAEAAWLKIVLMRSALRSGYRWVAFVDADCEIRPHAPCFTEEFQTFGDHKSIFMAHGFSGRINSGVIFLRNNEDSIRFLDNVLNSANEEVPPEDQAPYENGHMIMCGKNCRAVEIIDYMWNNNRALDENSYIQHYSGGILRGWYLEQRASEPRGKRSPHKERSVILLLLGKLRRKLSRVGPKPESTQSPPIQASMEQLVPFYQSHYPAFAGATDE
jgi:hypothetical protein